MLRPGERLDQFEVVRVLGSASSIARITSLYDITGLEIPLNDLNKGRIQREADNPLKEGDLLFNLAFGARVVLAGNINWTYTLGVGVLDPWACGATKCSTRSGKVRTAPAMKRRVMSTSSGFGPSSAVAMRGSRAMPHLGHAPGRSLRTSGSMGQM